MNKIKLLRSACVRVQSQHQLDLINGYLRTNGLPLRYLGDVPCTGNVVQERFADFHNFYEGCAELYVCIYEYLQEWGMYNHDCGAPVFETLKEALEYCTKETV